MTVTPAPLENTSIGSPAAAAVHGAWDAQHPFFSPTGADRTGATPTFNLGDGTQPTGATQPTNYMAALLASTPEGQSLDVPPMAVLTGGGSAPEIPAPVQQAISSGAPIRFSSPADDQQAGRQPDYFFTPDGQMVPNPKATPSTDGSVTIEIQSQDAKNNQSLRDAITHESDMQRQAANEMIQLFQKAHPGQQAPSWMRDLAQAKPNLPDFVPFPPAANAPVVAPPENGFANRGVSPGGAGHGGGGGGGSASDGGYGGFAGNGGFDNKGYFQGNGSSGDGAVPTGGTDSRGQPLGAGEQVQAKQLYDYFREHGFSSAQASGILGNIQTESSFRTDAHNAREGAIGLCQWEGGRRTALEHFAASEGKPVTDWHVQADFIMHELNTTESGAMRALKSAETPQDAAKAFQSQYERSASLGSRAGNARNIDLAMNQQSSSSHSA